MFLWRLPVAALLLLLAARLTRAYEDEIQIGFEDPYYNAILEDYATESTAAPESCESVELMKWDKLFSMLENSQMRENKMLQYADDVIKVELDSIRNEILRFIRQYGGSYGTAVETAGGRMVSWLEVRLQETLERFKLSDLTSAIRKSAENSNHLEGLLQQLLSRSRAQGAQLAKLESGCLGNMGADKRMNSKTGFFQLLRGETGGHREQEVMTHEAALDGLLAALQTELKAARQTRLPAGCDMALLFPMRSRQIYTTVIPDVSFSMSSFTLCMWVKLTAVSNKTVLFSYGNRWNPHETQLFLNQTTAVFSVGGDASLVGVEDMVSPGEWVHLCGAWSSDQGLATLWAGGVKVSSAAGMAKGHFLPDGGLLQLGQEKNGCCNPKLAFVGKMTGVNMWDRVLSDEELSQLALQQGQGCQNMGSIVAWGVTEMVPHGGAHFS